MNEINNINQDNPISNPPVNPMPIQQPQQQPIQQPQQRAGINIRCQRCGNFTNANFCPACGLDMREYFNSGIRNQYYNPYASPTPTKKNSGSVWAIIIAVIVIALFWGSIGLIYIIDENGYFDYLPYKDNSISDERNNNGPSESPNGVSAEEFEKLREGMTYAHMSAIIGGDGVLVDSGTNIYKLDYNTFVWGAENNEEAFVYITFIDGVATEIVTEGDL